MANDDLVKCPVCGSVTHIVNKDLLTALRDSRLREHLEKYVTQLLHGPSEELTSVSAGGKAERDFQKEVHSWNPNVPMWRRSSKE